MSDPESQREIAVIRSGLANGSIMRFDKAMAAIATHAMRL